MNNLQGFDAGILRVQRRRLRRRQLVLVLGLAIAVEILGVPALRTSYTAEASSGRILHARYWAPVHGAIDLRPGQVAPNCPLIVLVPLDRSLISYAGDALRALAEKVKAHV